MFSSLSWIIVSMGSHSPRGNIGVGVSFLPHVQIVYTLTLSISRREMGAVGDLVRLYTITHLTPGNISCHKEATVFSLHTRLGLSCQWRLHQFSGDWQVYKCPSSIYIGNWALVSLLSAGPSLFQFHFFVRFLLQVSTRVFSDNKRDKSFLPPPQPDPTTPGWLVWELCAALGPALLGV